jgi:hypothetical protein
MLVRRSFGPALVELIKNNCVPVAVTGGNGVFVMTAQGDILGRARPTDSSDPFQGVSEFKQLPESDRKPKTVPEANRYRLPPPPGGLVLRVYTRGFERSIEGGLQPIEKHSRVYSGPQRDFLWLTQEEWQSLVPAGAKKGSKLVVPVPIGQRLLRHHLVDNTITLGGPWKPQHLRQTQLTLTVKESSPAAVNLWLEGLAIMANDADLTKASVKGEFKLQGRISYDVVQGRVNRFDVIALGDFRNDHVSEYLQGAGMKKSLTLGVACELAEPGSAGYGSVPFALWDGVYSCKPGSPLIRAYFGTDPYTSTK